MHATVLAGERLLPLVPALAATFPAAGLRRGATVVVDAGADAQGAVSLALALAAGASAAGSWCAVVGVPDLGPVAAAELGRIVRPGGIVVAAHPGPGHLGSLRALVYADPRPHAVKPPLRAGAEWFETVGSERVTFPVVIAESALLADLFTMTPYRWHAPADMPERLDAAARGRFTAEADVVVTSYRRTGGP